MEALPIEQNVLPVTFGDLQNFRTETLTFEVVGFSGTYQAILRRPVYVKFMIVPNYTYLKLKILSPKGIITVGITYQRASSATLSAFNSLSHSSSPRVLTLHSLTTKVAHIVTAPGMLVGTHKRHYRIRTSSNGLGNIWW
jgi:hypothetical protein